MTAHAAIVVELPSSTTFAEAEEFVVKAQELGSCQPSSNPRQFLLSWNAPDLWLLRGLLEDVARDIGHYFG
jgi:hypothetical protein